MKIGIIREGKTPPDSRVPLIPEHCKKLVENHQLDVTVEFSPDRCYSNSEYEALGVQMVMDLSDRDILLGVKEVPMDQLLANKTYFFFSHTIKKQPYNRKLLQTVLEKNIRLIDYEVLRNEKGQRVIAFGKFAGMVGAHNGLMTFGKRTNTFHLDRMNSFREYAEAKQAYQSLSLPAIKIVLTGTGRVGKGAKEVLLDMGIKEVNPSDFLAQDFPNAVFTQLEYTQYAKRKDGQAFVKRDFYDHPELFESAFAPYAKQADLMINGIFWDNDAPAFFTVEEMRQADFKIQVIADVTCDIAPVSSIPSTLRPSTIADPVFGYDPQTGKEIEPYLTHGIDMMAIDNLPNELPRDASKAFGDQFLEFVLPELLKGKSDMIKQATIAENGQLGPHFQYLLDYVQQEEVG